MSKRIESVVITKGGKGMAVRRKDPATEKIEEVCLCLYNVDFSRGCIAQVHVSNLQEVIDNQGNYVKGNLERYKKQGLSDQRCSYCYSYTNMGGVFPRVVNEKTRASFDKHRPLYIRLGKITESGHPYYYPTLIDFLGLCKEYGSKIIFPTKALPFGFEGAKETTSFATNNNRVAANLSKSVGMNSGKNLAKLLKEVGGSLMYSIGYDKCEYGLISQGFTNEWRIRQAERFYREGINTSLTVVYFVSESIEENIKRGSAIGLALESKKKTGINIRILPLRIKSDKVAIDLTGTSYGKLKSDNNFQLFPDIERFVDISGFGLCEQRGNSELVSKIVNQDFLDLLKNGIGVCGQAESYEYCDKCNICQERISFPKDELIELDYSSRTRKPKRIKRKNKNQKRLF